MVQFMPQMSPVQAIGAFFLIWLVVWMPIAIPLMIWLKWQPFTAFTPSQKLPLLASLYAIAPLLLWVFAISDGHPFTIYGLHWHPALLRSGLVGIGLALLGLILLFRLQHWQTWVTWQPSAIPEFSKAIPLSFAIGLWISMTEELVFRGFLLNHLLAVLPIGVAAIATSLIFALLHLIWDQQETIPQLPGLWLMGMVLVLARSVDQGMLGLAIGLHAGWVGGMISLDSTGVIQYSDRAPAWFTGFAHKPLAGLGGILLMLLTGGLIYSFGS